MLERWIECDEWDQRGAGERPVIGLCARDGKRLIEKHPRLYYALGPFEPYPGAMAICVGCRWQDTTAGMRCGSPLAKFNGGPGLAYEQKPPMRAHICGGRNRRSGYQAFYTEPVTACSGREDVNEGRDDERRTSKPDRPPATMESHQGETDDGRQDGAHPAT